MLVALGAYQTDRFHQILSNFEELTPDVVLVQASTLPIEMWQESAGVCIPEGVASARTAATLNSASGSCCSLAGSASWSTIRSVASPSRPWRTVHQLRVYGLGFGI